MIKLTCVFGQYDFRPKETKQSGRRKIILNDQPDVRIDPQCVPGFFEYPVVSGKQPLRTL